MEATRKEHSRGLLFSHSFLFRSFPFFLSLLILLLLLLLLLLSFFPLDSPSPPSLPPSSSSSSSSSAVAYTKTHRGRPVHWPFSLSRLFFPAYHPLLCLFLSFLFVRLVGTYVRTAIGRQTPVFRMQFACHPSRLCRHLADGFYFLSSRQIAAKHSVAFNSAAITHNLSGKLVRPKVLPLPLLLRLPCLLCLQRRMLNDTLLLCSSPRTTKYIKTITLLYTVRLFDVSCPLQFVNHKLLFVSRQATNISRLIRG